MTEDSKTPEQMAEKHANLRCPEQGPEFVVWCMCRDDFLAGYQAAKDQLADADNVMNSPEKVDSCEHILDMEKMVDVNFSNNSNGWISVKDRLPPDGAKVLLIVFGDIHYGWIDQSPSDPTEYCLYFSNTYIDKGHHALTHWMPIPSKPKYMSDYVEYEAPKEAK